VAESVRIPREAIAPRPDPEVLLRIAIRERDGVAASRLVQQWVHRRGLSDLHQFQQNLVMGEDPAAGFWLRRQWDDPLADPPTSASPVPEAPLPTTAVVATEEPVAAPDPTAPEGAAPDPGSLSVSADAEEKSRQRDSSPLLGESFTEPLSEELRILLATPLEDPFGEPAPRTPRAAVPAMPPLAESGPETPHPTAFAAPAEGDEDDLAPAVADSPYQRRGTLSRMKARMRGYIDEAMGVLHRVALPSSLEEEGADQPSAASGPVDPSSSGSCASPSPDRATSQAGLFPQGPEESATAAPTPTTLADLRSWLPDASGDLPRAS
jgi:hypothetical protein